MFDPVNPRSILIENIQAKATIPEGLIPWKTDNSNAIGNDSKQNPFRALQQTLDSPYVNYAENERIAAAILQGDKIPVSTSGKVVYQPYKLIKKPADIRHTARLNFLEVNSDQALVHEVRVADELRASRSVERVTGYAWGNQFVEALPQKMTLKHKADLQHKSDSDLKVQSIAQAHAISKKMSIERNIMETKNLKSESTRIKDELKKANSRKLDERKLLSEIREKLHARLKEKNDPLLGPIMRCTDDSLLHHFLTENKGYSMSVDAIIALLGSTLGTEKVTAKAMRIDPDTYSLTTDKQPFANVEYGIRSPNHPSPRPVSGKFGRLNTPKTPTIGVELPPVYFPPPPTSALSRSVSTAKRLGAGFLTTHAEPRRNHGGSINHDSMSIRKEPIRLLTTNSVTDPDAAPIISRKKRFEEEAELNSFASIMSTDHIADQGINVIREQLLAEGKLPSTQAEKVLTDEQLYRIGSAAAGKGQVLETIMRQKLDKRSKRINSLNMNNNSHVKYDKNSGILSDNSTVNSSLPHENGIPRGIKMHVTEASEVAVPRSLKTIERDSPVLLHVGAAEQALFLSTNVASGAGLSLWGDRYEKLKKKYSPKKGTTVTSLASQKLEQRLDKSIPSTF